MNNELVKQEIANIISKEVNAAWRQYPAGVAQKKELTELGIIDLMPEGFAFTDAKVVLEALDEKTISGFDADGEGFADTIKSTLRALINEVDETQTTDETDYEENTAYFYSDEQQAIEDEVDELIEAATVEEEVAMNWKPTTSWSVHLAPYHRIKPSVLSESRQSEIKAYCLNMPLANGGTIGDLPDTSFITEYDQANSPYSDYMEVEASYVMNISREAYKASGAEWNDEGSEQYKFRTDMINYFKTH